MKKATIAMLGVCLNLAMAGAILASSPSLNLLINTNSSGVNQAQNFFQVTNTGATSVKLSDITIKFWADDTSGQSLVPHVYTGGCVAVAGNPSCVHQVTGVSVKATKFSSACGTDPARQANWVITVSNTDGSMLAPGATWSNLQTQVNLSNYASFSPGTANWYSPYLSPAIYVPNDHYAAYIAGNRVTGAPPARMTEFNLPSVNPGLAGMAAGPDGGVWFIETNQNKIGRISPTGAVTEFSLAGHDRPELNITTGSDGNLWFTGRNGLMRITPSGVITDFPIAMTNYFLLNDIKSGPDGNIWFSSFYSIGRMSTMGVLTTFALPPELYWAHEFAVGPDGNFWFTQPYGTHIGRLTPAGIYSEFDLPAGSSGSYSIVAGADGNLWFTDTYANKIGRITPTGIITEFDVPLTSNYPFPGHIAAGADGNLWFTEEFGNKVGRITTAGVVTEYPIPTINAGPRDIALGPDGNLWFNENWSEKIGKLSLSDCE